MTWEVRDVPPSVRRAAEKAADEAGKPLGDWLADTVRSAARTELGGLPAPPAPASAPVSVVPAASVRSPARLPPDHLAQSVPAPAENASPTPAPADAGPIILPTEPVIELPVAILHTGACRARQSGGEDLPPILARSIAAEGVRQPILARRLAGPSEAFEVVVGERRRAAAERAGQASVPAVVVTADDAEALTLSLRENLGRADFPPLDEARAYLRLFTEYRVSPTVLARRLDRERAHLALTLRLLGLPARVRQHLDSGQLGAADALALLDAADPEAMAERLLRGAARRFQEPLPPK